MSDWLLILVDSEASSDRGDDCRELARAFATYLQQPVKMTFASRSVIEAATSDATAESEVVPPMAGYAPAPAPMAAADFIWRDDGRPDWAAMWTSFCDLALFGGPPHRGEDSTLQAAPAANQPAEEFDAIAEIRRGIFETTGLFSEVRDDHWLIVTTESPRMAAWMAAAIILENVEARFDEERLLVPAHASFELKNEVKSVITVVAKVHHYWLEHVASLTGAGPAGVAQP